MPRFLFCVGLLVGLLCGAPHARAQSEPEPHVIEVTAAGEQAALAALEQRTRALLVGFQVVVAWSVSPQFRPRDVFDTGPRQALARLWLDARATNRAVLYLVDDAHERFLVRVVPLEAGYDEVACESIGTIVQSSVEALLAGASVGVDRAAAQAQVAAIEPEPASMPPQPSKAPVPETRTNVAASSPPRATEARSFIFGLDAGYRAAVLHATPALLHGPELGASLVRRGLGLSAAAQLHAGYRLPSRWQVSGVGATFSGVGARLAAGLRSGLTSAFSLSLLGTVGAELLHVEPRVSAGSEQARGVFDVVQPTLGAALESELAFGEHLAGWLAVGAEVDLLANRFDVRRQGTLEPVLEPWPVQPMVRIGARVQP